MDFLLIVIKDYVRTFSTIPTESIDIVVLVLDSICLHVVYYLIQYYENQDHQYHLCHLDNMYDSLYNYF